MRIIDEQALAGIVAKLLGRRFNEVYYNMSLTEQIKALVEVIERG